ncbi:uncharacterized protein N7482_005189 [Penicillium canariense]|uniref:Uncharacterized protein n=1 Tax=Penicillium canariense TaxID=189055 RepID=A0A9W9I4B6_9EURO|nr:uncharacterized protein N7482_005189 [Penicillium canariense]KAJ5166408.1 hypothetical protein N7482_005189 [Penicillium canariense]
MLLENGADPGQRDKWGAIPLGEVNSAAGECIEHPEKVPLLLELYRLFVREFGDELFEDLDRRWRATSGFQGPPEALSLIQGHFFKSYSDLSLDVRFKRTMTLDDWWVRASPSTLRIAMGGDHIDPAAYLLEDDNGETLLYRIVQSMAVDFAEKRSRDNPKWRQLLSEAIAASADPCHLSYKYGRPRTPLTEFLRYFTKNWTEIRRAGYKFHSIIQSWALELQLAGVDLEKYGAKEKALLMSGVVDPDVYIYVGLQRSGPGIYPGKGEHLHFHFLSLEFGPSPKDWKLWASNPVDELVWQFWGMVEKREQVMPGTWID